MSEIPSTLPRFLWYFGRRYKFTISGFIFIAIFWAINLSLSPYALKLIIDKVSEEHSNDGSLFSAVMFPVLLYVALGFSLGLVYRFYDWLQIKTFPKMKNEIIDEMFSYVGGQSYSYFQQNMSGSLSNKINDIAKCAVIVISNLIDHFFARTMFLIIGAFTMFFVNPYFLFLFFLWGSTFIIASIIFSRKSQQYSEIFSESRSVVVGKIVDSIVNMLNVKLFASEHFENQYLSTYLEDSAQKDRRGLWYLLKIKTFYAISATLLTASFMVLLIYERSKNMVTVGDFALILTLNMFLIEEMFFIANHLVPFFELVGTCKQALRILSIKYDVVDQLNARPLNVSKGQIVFDKVHFKYKENQAIFVNESITIHHGEKIGLVGFSGSGKSTFVNLILRFFDVGSGTILIDGQDIKKVTQKSLRSQIAMIPQDPVLFNRSLMDNIRYGRLEATDDEIFECAKKSYCHEFIEKFENGYQTVIGERGVKLSGGQRQRIAIARAILKNAPILILDEATSSLDSVTEGYIQQSLLLLMEGRTTIVVAHRLSTLFRMDRLLVFCEGKIVEDGTHSELIRLGGQYAKFWNMQAGGFVRNYQVDEYCGKEAGLKIAPMRI